MSAVVTKPFVILSGMSGSGKTQLAMRLGEWCGSGVAGPRFLLVPVRPDWTGPEAMFGYEDALRPVAGGRASWFAPSSLRFMLQASQDPTMPYVLLLDEMNLAHVERYFSDFLSGIESRTAVIPNLAPDADGEWRIVEGKPDRIPVPRNLVVIGTVNVDETTYQFSPKVLDRAATFEIRTRTGDLDDQVSRPTPIDAADDALLQGIVRLLADEQWDASSGLRGDVAASLRVLHERLAESDDEFGHRLFYEGLRLGAALEQCGVDSRDEVLDHLVLLKILPRLHGSRRRVEPVLRRLQAYCVDPDGPAEQEALNTDNPSLPLSLAKVNRMIASAEINQFVSFTD